MQALARLRFSLLGQDGPDREKFWRLYLGSSDVGRKEAIQAEGQIFRDFGPRLRELMGRKEVGLVQVTDRVRIDVVGIRYGSIELLVAIIGGEELASEMFWSAIEFFSSLAFTDIIGQPSVDMRAQIVDRTLTNANPPPLPTSTPTPTRAGKFEAIARSPLAAWILLGVAVIYFLGLRVEALEKETAELHHDYTTLVKAVMDQNTVLTTAKPATAPTTLVPASAPTTPAPTSAPPTKP